MRKFSQRLLVSVLTMAIIFGCTSFEAIADSNVSPRAVEVTKGIGGECKRSGSLVKCTTSWSYNPVLPPGHSASDNVAYCYVDVYIDGVSVDFSENTKVASNTVSVTNNQAASSGFEFSATHYGQTETTSETYWGTTSSSYYNRPSRQIALHEVINNFNDNIIEGFGYNLNELEKYQLTDSDLNRDVVYYFLFKMQRSTGDTYPSFYKSKSDETYFIVYQSGNNQENVVILDYSFDGKQPSITNESRAGSAISFSDFIN